MAETRHRPNRSTERTGARTRRDGRVQCHRHGKRLYPTQEAAITALVGLVEMSADTAGLNAYPCWGADGWHIGHWRAPWSALARKAHHDES